MKTLDHLAVHCDGEEIRITARARSFLHNQMRIIAGTLQVVGQGKFAPDDVARARDARARSAAGPTGPPEGLYLTHVGYGTQTDSSR